MEYNFREIEKKWQQRWVENHTYQVTEDESKKKFYVLNMFPYPSGAGLHVGHPLGYIASDIYARYKRLQGFNVLNPMGYDAYGQGWEMDAIAACVVGGVSFTGGIGKISGVVVGVFIFTALTYSLTILGIDTNLQFVFSGIIILVAVALDCLKYVQKK